MARTNTPAHLIEVLLTDRRVPWLIALVYVAASLVMIRTDYVLNDEGLFTYMSADYTRHAFAATFFFQKAKPVLCLLYLLPVWAGLSWFLIAHTLVAAAAIPMIASIARALDIRLANLAAIILAFSPVYFFGGAAGVANTDGVAAILLFLYLLTVHRQFFAAGAVLGLLPWVRHEMALFCVVAVLFGLVSERRPTLLLGALLFPVIYWLTGANYHHDLMWLIHYPPSGVEPPGPTAHNPSMPLFHMTATLSNALPYFAAVSPVIVLMFLVRRRNVTTLEWTLFGYSAAWLAMVTFFPFWQLGNFAFAPRYMLPILPATALLASRTASQWWDGDRPGVRWLIFLVVVLATLGLAHVFPNNMTLAVMLAVVSALLGAALTWRPAGAVTVVAALAFAAPVMGLPSLLSRRDLAGYLPGVERWLTTHRSEIQGPVYTNIILLGPHMRHEKSLNGLDLRYLMGIEHVSDLLSQGNKENGQIDAARRVLKEAGVPGAHCEWTDELSPATMPAGALFVFRPHDERIWLALPKEIWEPHLKVVTQEGVNIYRFVP